MSTKNQTTSQANFDPTAMNTYQGMQGGLGNTINSYMNSPFSNPFFQTQQQMGTQQANMAGQSNMSNITNNLTASGINQNSPAALEMMNNQMRQNSSMRANLGFLSPMQSAQGMQQNAMGLASSYRPLQTGQTQTQSQTGLGSWLPQVVGAGLSLATGGMSGGLKGLGGGGSSGSQMASPFFQTNSSPGMAGLNLQPQGTYNYPGLQAPTGYNMQSNPLLGQQP